MGANVEAIANRIAAGLRDADNDSWPVDAIYDAILEAERIITNFRPDATSRDVDFTCAVGIRQDLSSITNPAALRFLDALYNGTVETPGRSIRVVEMSALDRIKPDWRSVSGATVKEVMFDERTPLVFYNYPSLSAAATVRIAYSGEPTEYGTVDENTETTVSGVFEPMILECVFYRLFGHDVEGSVNISRSQKHWNNFQAMMGIKIEAEKVFSPKNPEHKR